MVCGASLPTTIVSYSMSVNVLKIEYLFLIRKPIRDRIKTKVKYLSKDEMHKLSTYVIDVLGPPRVPCWVVVV